VKILVTGARGFIGRNLVRELRDRGHHVATCDLGHSRERDYYRCDVGFYRQIERVIEAEQPEFVYHLAAEFGRWNGEDYYEMLWRSNAVGTKNIIRLQEKHGYRALYFSSSEVYGDWTGVMDEDVMDREEIKQLNDYALSKWVNEMQIMNSAAANDTESARVRLFNLYGPGEEPSPYRSALTRFVYYALTGQPYTVYSGHTRSWLYIDDAVQAFAQICERFEPGQVYNIGTLEAVDMKTLSDMILELSGATDALVTYEPEEAMTTHDKKVDISRAEKALDLRTTVPLREGLERTVEWMRSTL